MENKPAPICREHQKPKVLGQTTFEFKEDGVSVKVSGIATLVCPVGGEASFTHKTADELWETVRELLDSAKQMNARHPLPRGYCVSISFGSFGEQVKTATNNT